MPSTPEQPIQGKAAIIRWIALLDAAEALIQRRSTYFPPANTQVSQAFDALYAYEHHLTPPTRQLARERLWLRDRSNVPLPAGREEWALCRCRSCQHDRAVAWAHRRATTHEAQAAALARQHSY